MFKIEHNWQGRENKSFCCPSAVTPLDLESSGSAAYQMGAAAALRSYI